MIAHEDMPEYYNDIDIYVCASRTEGTPNTVLGSDGACEAGYLY